MSNKKQSRGNTQVQQTSDENPVVDVEVVQKDDVVVNEETTTVDEGDNVKKNEYELFREEHPFAERWDEADIDTWKKVMGSRKEIYVDGDGQVPVFNPRRENTPVNMWSTGELKAYLSGKLVRVNDNRRKEIADEYRNRVDVPDAWSDLDIVDYLTNDRTPPKTESGVWLRDVTRDKRVVSSWSNAELKAWVYEEIKSDIPSQKIINEVRSRFDLNFKEGTLDRRVVRKVFEDDQKRVEGIEKTITEGKLTKMNESHIDSVLEQYVTGVTLGKPISDQEAEYHQNNLESLFVYVTNLQGPALVDGLNKIKKKFESHRDGVFNPNHVHRFTHFVKGDAKVKRRHTNLLELLATVASPNKAQRKQVDYRMLLRDYPIDKSEVLYDYFKNYA